MISQSCINGKKLFIFPSIYKSYNLSIRPTHYNICLLITATNTCKLLFTHLKHYTILVQFVFKPNIAQFKSLLLSKSPYIDTNEDNIFW